jgi:hypothetical protein
MMSKVMRKRLDTLLTKDVRSRWRIILTCSFSIAVCGMALQASGFSTRDAQMGATTLGAFVLLAQVFRKRQSNPSVHRLLPVMKWWCAQQWSRKIAAAASQPGGSRSDGG